jgi:hypothetical protein
MIPRPKINRRNGENGSPSPKKFKTQKTASKVFDSVLWDRDGILIVDYLEKGAIIMADRTELVSICRYKLSKGIFFLKDNAALYKLAIIHLKLADLHFEVLEHPAYFPDLAPSDYYLFPNPKKTSRVESFRALRRPC